MIFTRFILIVIITELISSTGVVRNRYQKLSVIDIAESSDAGAVYQIDGFPENPQISEDLGHQSLSYQQPQYQLFNPKIKPSQQIIELLSDNDQVRMVKLLMEMRSYGITDLQFKNHDTLAYVEAQLLTSELYHAFEQLAKWDVPCSVLDQLLNQYKKDRPYSSQIIDNLYHVTFYAKFKSNYMNDDKCPQKLKEFLAYLMDHHYYEIYGENLVKLEKFLIPFLRLNSERLFDLVEDKSTSINGKNNMIVRNLKPELAYSVCMQMIKLSYNSQNKDCLSFYVYIKNNQSRLKLPSKGKEDLARVIIDFAQNYFNYLHDQ